MTRRSVTVVALPLLLMAAVTATPSPQIREPEVWQTLESGARKPVAGGRAGLKACPSLCHHTYAPVCGSDGKTYSNLCILQVVSCRNPAITLRHRGKCVFETDQGETRCPGACPFNYAPVCGNDGNTYANPCAFRVSACRNSALRVVANGPCEQMAFPSMRPACPSSCRGEYRPVCGSDGNTYGNQCTLDRVSCRNPSVTLAGRGACGTPYGTCPGVCAEVREPVCGSDGVTYQNECVFKAATCMKPSIVFKSTPGECAASQAPQDPCPVLCPAVYKPVCGSDGRTYANQCVMNSAACNNPSLATSSQGECQLTQSPPSRYRIPTTTKTNATPNFSPFRQSCPNYCGRIFSPVCGSDGKTYYNRCLLRVAACSEGRALVVAYLGLCG